MAEKRAVQKLKSDIAFGKRRNQPKMFRAGRYARVSTADRQTLRMQSRALKGDAALLGRTVGKQIREVNSGATRREARRDRMFPRSVA